MKINLNDVKYNMTWYISVRHDKNKARIKRRKNCFLNFTVK